MSNPYSTAHPWSQEVHAAWASMPKLDGYIVALEYVRADCVDEYEARWREWYQVTPKHLHPPHLARWAMLKKHRGVRRA